MDNDTADAINTADATETVLALVTTAAYNTRERRCLSFQGGERVKLMGKDDVCHVENRQGWSLAFVPGSEGSSSQEQAKVVDTELKVKVSGTSTSAANYAYKIAMGEGEIFVYVEIDGRQGFVPESLIEQREIIQLVSHETKPEAAAPKPAATAAPSATPQRKKMGDDRDLIETSVADRRKMFDQT